jgi:superfamily II DNA or RNA helicase
VARAEQAGEFEAQAVRLSVDQAGRERVHGRAHAEWARFGVVEHAALHESISEPRLGREVEGEAAVAREPEPDGHAQIEFAVWCLFAGSRGTRLERAVRDHPQAQGARPTRRLMSARKSDPRGREKLRALAEWHSAIAPSAAQSYPSRAVSPKSPSRETAPSASPASSLPLDENMRRALAGLALWGHANISTFVQVATALGARHSATRAFSTHSLRQALVPLIQAGWVREVDGGFECGFGVGTRVLRSFEPPVLREIVEQYKSCARGWAYDSPFGSWSGGLALDARVGFAHGHPNWLESFEQLIHLQSPLAVAALLVQEPLRGAFDRAWFERFERSTQERLAELLLLWAEASAAPLLGFAEYAADPGGVVQTTDALRQAWLRLQLLRGGASVVSDSRPDREPASSGVAFLRLVTAGDYEAARQWLARTQLGKRAPLLDGAAGVFQVLLLAVGGPIDAENAARLVNLGARKNQPFAESHGLLKRLLAQLNGKRSAWIEVLKPRKSVLTDALFELLQGLCALWFKELEPDRPIMLMEAEAQSAALREPEASWLAQQYADLVRELVAALPERAQRELIKSKLIERIEGAAQAGVGAAASPTVALFSPLRLLLRAKPVWETALTRLEGLAAQEAGTEEAASSERVLWRVGVDDQIEPYLQRATPTGWTRGRRLALKHLLPGAAQRASLPPEDLRVADYARERVTHNYGYREVHHYLEHGVWQALIGHSRVFLGESDVPTEVARGTLRLLASTEGDQFRLQMQPAGVTAQSNVRREGDRLVVYVVSKATQRVLEVVDEGLSVPLAERERLLSAAARLTHLVPLHSSEPALTNARTGDATPHLRLTPRGAEMTAMLVVRPLGERGPTLSPGQGSPLILARIDGTAEQASRDLALEAKLAAELMSACPPLAGRQIAEYEWLLESAEACLDLLAALAPLGDRVRVEWPHGKALKLRGRLDRGSLRGRLSRKGAAFYLDASLSLDADTSLPLSELLQLLAEQRGRFVRLEQGDFLELSAELRERLSAIAAAGVEEPGNGREIALPATALSALEALSGRDSLVQLDAPALKWRDEFAKIFDSKPRVPRGLNAQLRDYQLDGFRWLARLAELGFGACLADDMGLGKTVQLIALLLHRARSGPALVVAPTSVVENWRRELERFAPSLEVRSYAGSEREPLLEGLGPRVVVITGYSLLQLDTSRFQAVAWGTAILDEAQFIKNTGAQRTRAALALNAAMRIAATGTPVENQAEDLYSLFQFVQPGLLGSAASFRRRFPLDAESALGRESRRRLRQLIQPFLLRRTKAQVLAELPPITEIEHQVELSAEEVALYDAVRRSALEKLEQAPEGGSKLAILAELMRLRRLCCHPKLVLPETNAPSSKLREFGELMAELVAAGHRTLVFSQFVDVLKLAGEVLSAQGIGYQYLDGASTPKQRSAAIDAFQNGEGEAFLISLKAGGFGLNLTAADYVIHLDPWWNPAAEAQATDRAHRIGQQKPVTVYRLVAKGTIEERIVTLHRSKRELADSLLAESDQAASLSSKELRALLEV